jgi:hypothetical protein
VGNYQTFERTKRLVGYVIGSASRLLKREATPLQSEASLRSEDEYYSLIAGEVSKLPNNTHLARQALYDRTWVATVAELLHGQGSAPSDAEVTREHLAFQRALCKVEVEMAMDLGRAGEVPA